MDAKKYCGAGAGVGVDVWMLERKIILEPGTWNQPAAWDLGGFPCGWAGMASACRTDLQSACAHGCRRRHRAGTLGHVGT